MESIDILTAQESEGVVIGAIMQHGAEAYDRVSSIIRASDFSDTVNGVMFSVMQKRIMDGLPGDIFALIDYFTQNPAIPFDLDYARELSQNYVPMSTIKWHAQQVADKSKERKARAILLDGMKGMNDTEKTLQQRVGGVVAALEDVVSERVDRAPVMIRDLAVNLIDNVMAVAEGRAIAGRPTHIPSLDKKTTGGMRDGKLVVIAARPSIGKSSFAMQILISQALDGVPGAFFGMEMENDEVTMRAVANLGRAPLSGMMSGNMDDEEWSRMSEGVERVTNLPLHLFDKEGMTLAEVVSEARKLVRKHKIKNLGVDYLQLMKGSDEKKDKRIQYEEITRGLKRLAKELGITVYLLSQLNREVDKRTDPRPVMSDLKECGAIEEDADIIIFLWDHKDIDDETKIKGAKIGKNRGGQKGEFAMHFQGSTQRWTESSESLHTPEPQKSARRGGFAG